MNSYLSCRIFIIILIIHKFLLIQQIKFQFKQHNNNLVFYSIYLQPVISLEYLTSESFITNLYRVYRSWLL